MTIKICRSGCVIRTTDNGYKDVWVTDNAELETGHWCQKPSDHKPRLPGTSRVFTCAVAEMRDKLPPADLCRNGCFSITDSENRKWTWITTCVNEEEIGHENGHWCLNTEDHLPKGGERSCRVSMPRSPQNF